MFLVLVTALAALVRLFHLGSQSLWVDEIITWRMVQPGVGLQFWEQIRDAIQGPLYLATVWPLVRLEGSEFLLRLPAALAGVAAVPLLAAAGARILCTRSARIAGLLLALSPFHLWYSQEARGYTFVVLFALAATLVFWQMATRGPRPLTVLLYCLFSVCGVWSNMSGLFLWAGHFLTVLLIVRPQGGRDRALWLVAMLGGLLAALPWVLRATGIWAVDRLVPGAETGSSLRGETTFTPLALPYAGFVFFYGFSLGPSLAELHQPDRLTALKQELPLLLVAGAVSLAAVLAGLRQLQRQQWSLVLWIVVALAAVTLLALRNIKAFNPRYLAVVFPWILLLAAHGAGRLPRRWGGLLTAALLLLSLWSVGQHHFNQRYAKADLRSVAACVAAHETAGEVVLVPSVAGVFHYYFQGESEVVASFREGTRLPPEQLHALLREKMEGADRGWLVLARNWHVDPQNLLAGFLAEEATVSADTSFVGARLMRWRRSPEEGISHGS